MRLPIITSFKIVGKVCCEIVNVDPTFIFTGAHEIATSLSIFMLTASDPSDAMNFADNSVIFAANKKMWITENKEIIPMDMENKAIKY